MSSPSADLSPEIQSLKKINEKLMQGYSMMRKESQRKGRLIEAVIRVLEGMESSGVARKIKDALDGGISDTDTVDDLYEKIKPDTSHLGVSGISIMQSSNKAMNVSFPLSASDNPNRTFYSHAPLLINSILTNVDDPVIRDKQLRKMGTVTRNFLVNLVERDEVYPGENKIVQGLERAISVYTYFSKVEPDYSGLDDITQILKRFFQSWVDNGKCSKFINQENLKNVVIKCFRNVDMPFLRECDLINFREERGSKENYYGEVLFGTYCGVGSLTTHKVMDELYNPCVIPGKYTYSGQFWDNKFCSGKVIGPDGTKAKGKFYPQPYATVKYFSGRVKVSKSWVNLKEGDRYTGEVDYSGVVPHGNGTLTFGSGKILEGKWSYGAFDEEPPLPTNILSFLGQGVESILAKSAQSP